MNNPAEKSEIWYIDRLIPYAKNSRTHSDEQIAQIASSMREWGFTNPVLIDPAGNVIAGHGRLLAARKLLIDKIPVVIADGWTDAQKRAYIIADNKLALNAGWDNDMLALELTELDGMGFDLDLTGFSEEEIGMFSVEEIDMPSLSDGDKEPFQQMTFTLHDEQVNQIIDAMAISKSMGPFIGSQNENGNGNALARICETFMTQNGNS